MGGDVDFRCGGGKSLTCCVHSVVYYVQLQDVVACTLYTVFGIRNTELRSLSIYYYVKYFKRNSLYSYYTCAERRAIERMCPVCVLRSPDQVCMRVHVYFGVFADNKLHISTLTHSHSLTWRPTCIMFAHVLCRAGGDR